MTETTIIYILIALGTFVALLVLYFIARKLFGNKVQQSNATIEKRLSIIDALPVDQTRQLVLIKRDHTEHLVMIGGSNDLIVESNITTSQTRLNNSVDSPRLAERPLAEPILPVEKPATAAAMPLRNNDKQTADNSTYTKTALATHAATAPITAENTLSATSPTSPTSPSPATVSTAPNTSSASKTAVTTSSLSTPKSETTPNLADAPKSTSANQTKSIDIPTVDNAKNAENTPEASSFNENLEKSIAMDMDKFLTESLNDDDASKVSSKTGTGTGTETGVEAGAETGIEPEVKSNNESSLKQDMDRLLSELTANK